MAEIRAVQMLASSGEPLVATFGFGSNSVRQLRGRLKDSTLLGFPARVQGHALAFAGPNQSWAHDDDGRPGGTATLIPLQGEVALGTVCFLSHAQLETLDYFEGAPRVYARHELRAEVLQKGSWLEMPVVAYLKVDSREWHAPSEAYCCAVLRNIRGSFPSLQRLVLRDTDGRVRDEWRHPGHHRLSAGAFLFEVGVRRREPWSLPSDIGRFRSALVEAGIQGSVEAWPKVESVLAQVLAEEEEINIALRLLKSARSEVPGCDETGHELSDDEAQAERSPTVHSNSE
eukprot:TRINITY_DN63476_c0_g1_i1.p1 TRINITY_DN63476_c0_g1~~TRINITY_DN63476_c0_g1_i1.p1  ORF type:complete len:287 (+),score=51.60 TRINITY_DN63476_c0_g1_i1:55-915(+)